MRSFSRSHAWGWAAALVLSLGLGGGGAAQAPARPFSCAVEGGTRGARSAHLCGALARELKRTVTIVDDARSVTGEAVQIIRGDVLWTVIWLLDGKVRAWTRVSLTEAADDQVRFVVRATEALAKASVAPEPECVRLDPNGGRKMRSSDLTYPWAELKPCKRKLVEVVDPWWLPERSGP
jgi:hypothetical protein